MTQRRGTLGECVGCGEHRPVWTLLQFSASGESFGLEPTALVDGYLPVCGRCVPTCPTCRRPVPTPQVERVVADRRARSDYIVRWWVEPCGDPQHERPPRESFPRDPRLPVYGPPDPPTVVPGRSELLASCRGVAINDYVTADGVEGVGRVKYITSTFGFGAFAVVGYPDGQQLSKRPSELVVVPKPDAQPVGGTT